MFWGGVLTLYILKSKYKKKKRMKKPNWPGCPYPNAPRDSETGFPYPPSEELKKQLDEERQRRIEIVRTGGVEALSAYLNIMNPRNKK
jgi:hypothetical protein